MSQISIKPPVVHTPGFNEYKISGSDLHSRYKQCGCHDALPNFR